jgi:hypothetical protein
VVEEASWRENISIQEDGRDGIERGESDAIFLTIGPCLDIPDTQSFVLCSDDNSMAIQQGRNTRHVLGREVKRATDKNPLTSPCPSRTRSHDPLSTSHTRIELSDDLETTRWPSDSAHTMVTYYREDQSRVAMGVGKLTEL